MDRNELIKQLEIVFIDVLNQENILLTEQTTATDIEEWDSLSHIELVVAIEKYFKIRFTSKEIQSWNNVGEMINTIIEKV